MKPRTLLRRREFIQSSTGLLTGLLAPGSALALIAPGRMWAAEMVALSSTEAATLMAVTRTIAPHDKLDDAAYALVTQAIDRDAGADPKIRKTIREGIAGLGKDFVKASEHNRVEILKKAEASDFFQTVRRKTLQVLYDTPMAYAHFGYEGEAFSKGGYLRRGFNDLRWLPEVPEADSGPLPFQTGSSGRRKND